MILRLDRLLIDLPKSKRVWQIFLAVLGRLVETDGGLVPWVL